MVPLGPKDHKSKQTSKKITNSRHKKPSFQLFGAVKETSKAYRLFLLALLPTEGGKKILIVEGTIEFRYSSEAYEQGLN